MENIVQNNLPTKEKLIRVGIRLFSKYGYDATSIRMIAREANVNISAISFHFSGKDSLYSACLTFVAEMIHGQYEGISEKVDEALARDSVTPEEAFEILRLMTDRQLEIAFGVRNSSSLRITYWEQLSRDYSKCPVSNAIYGTIEKPMAELIAKASHKSYNEAIIASRYINGSIISFGEHKLLVKLALGDEASEDSQGLKPWVCDEIRNYSYLLLRNALGIKGKD